MYDTVMTVMQTLNSTHQIRITGELDEAAKTMCQDLVEGAVEVNDAVHQLQDAGIDVMYFDERGQSFDSELTVQMIHQNRKDKGIGVEFKTSDMPYQGRITIYPTP